MKKEKKELPLDYKKMFMEVFKAQIKSEIRGKYSTPVLDETLERIARKRIGVI